MSEETGSRRSTVIGVGVLALLHQAAMWLLPRTVESSAVLPSLLMVLVFLPVVSLTRVRLALMQGLGQIVRGRVPEQLVQPLQKQVIGLLVFGQVGGDQQHVVIDPAGDEAKHDAVVELLERYLVYRQLDTRALLETAPMAQRRTADRTGGAGQNLQCFRAFDPGERSQQGQYYKYYKD